MLTVVEDGGSEENGSAAAGSPLLIDEIVRDGARRMLAAALEAEVDAYLAEVAGERDESGRRLVVRNGHAQPRTVMTSAGAVEVVAPRVNDKRLDPGQRARLSSAVLPPWCRTSPKIAEVGPLRYLHGLSSGDFTPALEQFLGSSAGLSAATVTRLTSTWQADYRAFKSRPPEVQDRRGWRATPRVGQLHGRGSVPRRHAHAPGRPLDLAGSDFAGALVTRLAAGDFRHHAPRFSAENLAANNDRYTPVRTIAAELGLTPGQLALAWLLAQDPAVVPIPGSRTPAHVIENAESARIALPPDTLRRVDAALAAFDVVGGTLL